MEKVILTGDRPTGKLHLGYWLSAPESGIAERWRLQQDVCLYG